MGQRTCLNYKTNRVIAIFSEMLDFAMAFNGSNPAQPWPTDELVDLFIKEDPSDPVNCSAYYPSLVETGSSSSSFGVGYSVGTALMIAGFVATLLF